MFWQIHNKVIVNVAILTKNLQVFAHLLGIGLDVIEFKTCWNQVNLSSLKVIFAKTAELHVDY